MYNIIAKGIDGGIAAKWSTWDRGEALKMFRDYITAYSDGIMQTVDYIIILLHNDIIIKKILILKG